ncbi:MAG TPA: hypothetical protein VLM40_07700, partial [Gemmata sp.]|nr:hypothetical protein [Gemmata sp.]
MLRRVLQSLGLSVAVFLCGDTSAMAQPNSEPLRLDGLFPVGGRNTLTEAWGTLQFGIDNRGDDPRQARVVVFYPSQPDLHYTRDVWIPAHARVISWVSIGPAPELKSTVSREIAYQLFDRTGGGNREVHTRDPEHILTRAEPYRRRDPTTAVYLDASVVETSDPNPLDDPKSGDSESLRFVQVFRDTRNLSERVSIIQDRYLPPSPEAFDGIDQFVLAGNRLAADPAGMQALRHWVLHGGTLWVLLDRVNPEVVAPILGDGLRFQVVGRTGLTTVRVRRAKQDRDQAEKWDFDRPVDLVQVLLSGSEEVLFDANDWPAAFSQTLGRGRVIFTALGPRGWYQDRTPRDPPSHFEHVPDLPVPRWTLGFLSGYIFPEPEKEKVGPDALAPMLAAEVGYEVVGRRTATGILAAFLVGVLVLAILLRRSRWPEIIGLGAPAVAVAATAAFLIAGVNSRRAVPSTAAAVAMVSVSPDCREEQWHGLFAVYQPSSGVVEVGTDRGGQLDFDQSGLEGLTRRQDPDVDQDRADEQRLTQPRAPLGAAERDPEP